MADFTYGTAGLALTKQSEGCELNAYQDPVGIWTIGYGHTGPAVVQGFTITQEQADALLVSDVAGAVACVNKAVQVQINQNQFDALVDFTFNLGCASLLSSTLLRLLNAGDFDGAAGQFARWVYAGKTILPGLERRRAAELQLFQTPWNPPPPAG